MLQLAYVPEGLFSNWVGSGALPQQEAGAGASEASAQASGKLAEGEGCFSLR